MERADDRQDLPRLKQALQFANEGKAQKARALLVEAVRVGPPGPALFLGVGDGYAALDDSNQARMFWRAAAARGAAMPDIRAKAQKRLAMDAKRRARIDEAVSYMERYLEDRPNDLPNVLRLLIWKLAIATPQSRGDVLRDCREKYPSLHSDLLDLVVVMTVTDPPRAAGLLVERAAELVEEREIGLLTVEYLAAAGQAEAALQIAERLFEAKNAGAKELNVLLRAEQAAGRRPTDFLNRYEAHLARYPHDYGNRVKKARLLFQIRQWQAAYAEAELVLKKKPADTAAALIMIQALVRLDRPEDAKALRDQVAERHMQLNPDNKAVLVTLDLALSDSTTALERGNQWVEEAVDPAAEQAARIDAFMATGAHAQAMDLLAAAIHNSDDMTMRSKAVQCASALRLVSDPEARFPEGALRSALARRAIVSGERKSVVLVTSTLGAGGAERQIALTTSRIVEPMKQQGLETYLVCRDLRPEYGNATMLPMLLSSNAGVVDLTTRDAAVAVREMRATRLLDLDDIRLLSALPLSLYRAVIVLYEQFRKLSPRVVHLWQDGIITAGGVAAVMAGVPRIVAAIRNLVPLENDTRRARPYLGAVYRCLEQRPEVVLTANSEMGARDYEAKFGLRPNSIRVIRNGLDVDAVIERCGPDGRAQVRQQLGIADGVPVLGGVFRLVPAKRPQRWLEVAARVASQIPDLRMLIVGDGPLRGALELHAESLGIGKNVYFSGRQSPVEPWIAAMDTMLLASDIEGLPNVLIEGQALGVPIVTTDAGGTREAVHFGVTGTVAEHDTIEDLAAACLHHLTSQQARLQALIEGPRFIRSRFGVDRMVNETLSAFGVAN